MKKILSIIALTFSFFSFSQNWMDSLPKSKSEYTFYDFQDAFNKYWAPYKVKNGYYYKDGVKKKAYGWKQFKRWEYQMKFQIDKSTGKVSISSIPENSKSETQIEKSGNWISKGSLITPGGYAGLGRVSCVTFHPTDFNVYWVGTASGGIWRTTDNGVSWANLSDHIEVLSISNIVIPSDYDVSQTIYISTGDKDCAWAFQSVGILKSTDGGNTWNTTGITYSQNANKMVYKLLMNPLNSNELIASTTNGVYKTVNGGTTWNTQLSSLVFSDLEYNPQDPSIIYGSTFNGQIYKSINSGVSWTSSYNNSNVSRIELAVSPADPLVVYGIGENNGLTGIYKSTDSGSAYTEVFSGTTLNLLNGESSGIGEGGNGWWSLAIDCSPTDANILLVGGVNTWKSTDGGSSFQIVNHWWGDQVQAVHADKHLLRYRLNGDLFECNDGGIYLSLDNGSSWQDKSNGLAIGQIYRITSAQQTIDETMTGLQDNGTKLLSQGIWSDILGGDGMDCAIDYTNSDFQYSSFQNGVFYRTFDHWISSEEINTGNAGNGAWVTPMIIDPINPSRLYIGFDNVMRSDDYGTTWETISSLNSTSKLNCIAVSNSDNKYIYISNDDNIWKSSDEGVTWTLINQNLPLSTNSISSILVKNDDENTVWITMGGFNNKKVYVTTNGGASWTNISAGLPLIPVYNIIQNKQSNGSVHLYVGTKSGVYFKSGNENWVSFNSGLPNVQISDLDIYYTTPSQNSILKAGSYGRGLWERQVIDFASISENTNDDFKIFPNPSNGKINIQLKNQHLKNISVYNQEGKMVYHKNDNQFEKEILLDLTFLKSGFYTLELNFEEKSVRSIITIESK